MDYNIENNLVLALVNKLKPYFYVELEVWSTDSKSRIDVVLTDKKYGKSLGIESKAIDYKRGNDLGIHILQSMRYVTSEFITNKGVQKLPIFICPPISYNYLMCPVPESRFEANGVYGKPAEYYHDRHPKNSTHHTVNGMIGAFGIGEVRTLTDYGKQYIYFTMSNKIVWDSRPIWDEQNRCFSKTEVKGLHLENYEKLITKKHDYRF